MVPNHAAGEKFLPASTLGLTLICVSHICCNSNINNNSTSNVSTVQIVKKFTEEDKNNLLKEHKRRISIILSNIFEKRDALEPISQINQNEVEETMNEINTKLVSSDIPRWVVDSWEIIKRLNPRGGWLSTITLDLESTRDKVLSLENEIKEKRKEFTIASKFYLKRQFSDNEWELVIMEKNFMGKAVFRGDANEVREKRLEGRIVAGIVLKNEGKEPFQYDRYNAYGHIGRSTEYYYVYELGDYNFQENETNLASLKREMEPKIIELNKAHEMLRNAYKNYQKIYPPNKGETS